MTANEWNMVVVAYVVPRGNTSASVPSMHLPSTEPPSPSRLVQGPAGDWPLLLFR